MYTRKKGACCFKQKKSLTECVDYDDTHNGYIFYKLEGYIIMIKYTNKVLRSLGLTHSIGSFCRAGLLCLLFTAALGFTHCSSGGGGGGNGGGKGPESGPEFFFSVSTGNDHTCAIFDNYVLKCWGKGSEMGFSSSAGQLGQGHTDHIGDGMGEMGDALNPIDLGSGRAAKAVATGDKHTCAILDDNTVKCWGDSNVGQIGAGQRLADVGDEMGEMGDALNPIELGSGRTAKAITAGDNHTCAILDDNTVKCWGGNGDGQLGQGNADSIGDGSGEMGDDLDPIALGDGRTAKAITAGTGHTCALLDDNTVKCWGGNSSGQLGQGNTDSIGDGSGEMGDTLNPIDLGSGRTAKAVAAGNLHTCAILDDNTVKCWGGNSSGQLGQGNAANIGDGSGEMGDALAPIDLGDGRTAKAITAGANHTCALLDDNTVKCWGHGNDGRLGNEAATSRVGDAMSEMGDALAPIDLGSGRTAKAITAGANHTCALLDDNAIKCWGGSAFGQLGQGGTANIGNMPGQMGDALPPIDL